MAYTAILCGAHFIAIALTQNLAYSRFIKLAIEAALDVVAGVAFNVAVNETILRKETIAHRANNKGLLSNIIYDITPT